MHPVGQRGAAVALVSLVLAVGVRASESVYIAKAECRLFFASDGELIKEYPCATGRGMCSPVGSFTIQNKRQNGGWRYTGGQWTYVGGAAIPALGPLWMGLTTSAGRGTNYGIHGNNNAASIGTLASAGCIRMHNKHVDELYAAAPAGTKVRLANYLTDLQDDLKALHAYSVVFAADDDGDYDLHLIGSDGQGRSRLLDLPGHERSPVFSPDGASVAFVHWTDGVGRLACVRLESGELTEFEQIDATECVDWSESGLTIRASDGASWRVDLESAALTGAEPLERPGVSDDGESIVLTSPRGRPRSLAAAAIRPRLPGPARMESPRLSSDGARLAFSCQVGKQRDLFACRADGRLTRNLTESEANETDPAWSPIAVYAPGVTLLKVETAPAGLEIRLRPAGSKQADPPGRSPAEVPIVSASAGGSEFEVIVSEGRPGREVSSVVRLRRGERASLFLDLNAAPAPDGAAADADAEQADPVDKSPPAPRPRVRFFDALRRLLPEL